MASKVNGLIEQINVNNSALAIASTAYGYCETDAGTAAKTVDMTGFILYDGVTIHVKFKNNNTAANPTLNVNSTGARAIVQYGTTASGNTSTSNGWYAGAVVTLTYDKVDENNGYWIRDQDSWRGIVDNLTSSTNTTQSLSAKQGYLLANGSARDNTKLPLAGGIMTGNIRRYYADASTEPMITALSNNKDIYLFQVGHGEAAATNLTSNGYKLLYKGINSSTNNYLQLIATQNNGTETLAMQIDEIGNILTQGNLKLTAESGNSPALLFTRSGNLTDWKIQVVSGKLSFQSATDAATWTERAYFKDNSGDFVATSFTGKGSELTNLNASNISSGTLSLARLGNQNANLVLAGPSSGSTAAPTFRTLVAADIPNLSWNKITSDKPTTLAGYGITDAASSGHSHTLKIGYKSLSVSTSTQTWTARDILYDSNTTISLTTDWDIINAGIYSVVGTGDGSFTGNNNPGTNQNMPYKWGHLIVTRAGDAHGVAQFYIAHTASGTKDASHGIRYRSGWNGNNGWQSWATILDDKNYNLYVPTLTGTGASGSWGISITGNAANVTGTVTIDHGGTGATTAAEARTNLGITAANVVGTGTTAQFYRGDNSWSNTIKQTANTTLEIDSNLKIGTARKDLNFDIGNGSGTGINDGYAGGITWGNSTSAYAGIYYQSSGSYGSRLIFGTTSSYANGAYARMIITHDGKVGIGTLSPSYKLSVNGDISATNFRGALIGNADTATEFSSNATVTLTGDTTGTSEGSTKSWTIATTTTKLSQTTLAENSALSSFIDSTALIYMAAPGSNTFTGKPTSVDAFGCIAFKAAAGWYAQILVSSDTATGLFWRTATTLKSDGTDWKKLLDSSNYKSYAWARPSTITTGKVILSSGTDGSTELRTITNNTSNTAITNNTNIPTMNTIYYGLVTVNNASQTRATGIYAPTSAGTAGNVLVSAGGTSAPSWYSGASLTGTAAANWTASFSGTTDSSSTTSGAVKIAGGLGVAKQITALRLAANGSNTSYSLYVNGTSNLKGATTIDGDLSFTHTGVSTPGYITWSSGSYLQRIFVQDDATANTAVFTFQQNANTGTTYTNLFTILDNKSVATDRYNYTVSDVIKAYTQYNTTDDSIDFIFA